MWCLECLVENNLCTNEIYEKAEHHLCLKGYILPTRLHDYLDINSIDEREFYHLLDRIPAVKFVTVLFEAGEFPNALQFW